MKRFEEWLRSSLLGSFSALFLAKLRFRVEQLRNWRRPAGLAQGENVYFEVTRVVSDIENVSSANLSGRLYRLIFATNTSELAGFRCEGSSFEKSGGPQPFVDPHACHAFIVGEF